MVAGLLWQKGPFTLLSDKLPKTQGWKTTKDLWPVAMIFLIKSNTKPRNKSRPNLNEESNEKLANFRLASVSC